MALPSGTWNLNGNGFQGELNIVSIDMNGNVTGTAYNDPVQGFWDDAALKLVLMRIPNVSDPSTIQVFTGYLFEDSGTYTLAGSFQFFAGTGGGAKRQMAGWFAQKAPLQAIPMRIDVTNIQDHLQGTPQQVSLVHTYPRVMIGGGDYVGAWDNENSIFKKTVTTDHSIPVHVEIWRNLDHIIGVVKQENGKWIIDYGSYGKQPLPAEYDSLTDEEKMALHPELPGPPGVIEGIARSLDIAYSHAQGTVTGDVSGPAGTPIAIPNGAPNTVGFDLSISESV